MQIECGMNNGDLDLTIEQEITLWNKRTILHLLSSTDSQAGITILEKAIQAKQTSDSSGTSRRSSEIFQKPVKELNEIMTIIPTVMKKEQESKDIRKFRADVKALTIAEAKSNIGTSEGAGSNTLENNIQNYLLNYIAQSASGDQNQINQERINFFTTIVAGEEKETPAQLLLKIPSVKTDNKIQDIIKLGFILFNETLEKNTLEAENEQKSKIGCLMM